jgi:hypothetical protein
MLPQTDTFTAEDYAEGDVVTFGPDERGILHTAVVTRHTVHPTPGFDGYALGDAATVLHGQDDQIIRVLGRYRRAVLIGIDGTQEHLRAVEKILPPNYHAAVNCNQILVEGWDVKGATLIGKIFPKFAKMGCGAREVTPWW